MVSLEGIPSSLIARNESWVRQCAQSLMRRMPSNVEKADLIQVGLIAVAQAATTFVWQGDADTAEGREAFLRYARLRVRGAMVDELRQMDRLTRAQRRRVKAAQVFRERHRAAHGSDPSLGATAGACGLPIDELAALDALAAAARAEAAAHGVDGAGGDEAIHPSTGHDEVEARVDTAIVLRRLEKVFAELPERERMVIDSLLGVGLKPVALAERFGVTPSRISQIQRSLFGKLARLLAPGRSGALPQPSHAPRACDRADMDMLVRERESELRADGAETGWGEMIEQAFLVDAGTGRITVPPGTRWG